MKNKEKIFTQAQDIKKKFKASAKTEKDTLSGKFVFLDSVNSLVRLILDDDSATVYDALNEDTIRKWHKERSNKLNLVKTFLYKNKTNFLYFLLLCSITGFLVSEALGFYSADDIVTAKTYIKAILTEVCFIFLSGYRASSRIELSLVSILRVSIFTLMVLVITSQVLLDGSKNIGNTESISKQITLIEKQIKEKEKNIIYYRDVKKWPITTKQLIKEKDLLVNELLDLRKQQASGSNKKVSELVKYRMYGRAVFRIILLFISVLITRRIFKF